MAQRHTDLWNRHRTRAKVFKASKADLEMKTASLVFLHRPFSQSKNGKALLTRSFFWGYFWMQVQMKHVNSGSPQCWKPVENTSFSKPQFVQVGCFVLCHLADMEISIFRPSYFCFFFFDRNSFVKNKLHVPAFFYVYLVLPVFKCWMQNCCLSLSILVPWLTIWWRIYT